MTNDTNSGFAEIARPVLQVKFSNDYKTVEVQTTETAPGGARTERVALPYDPDLYHHMAQHGVNILVSPAKAYSWRQELSLSEIALVRDIMLQVLTYHLASLPDHETAAGLCSLAAGPAVCVFIFSKTSEQIVTCALLPAP